MEERRTGWLRRTPGVPGGTDATPRAADASSPEQPPAISTVELGCELEGELRLDGPLMVHGDFKGSIDCADVVTVGAGGSVQGPIRARRVLIHGGVVGAVEATRDVVLHAGAKLHGDVRAPSLVVERGAFFNGRSEMVPSPVARGRSGAAPQAVPRGARPSDA